MRANGSLQSLRLQNASNNMKFLIFLTVTAVIAKMIPWSSPQSLQDITLTFLAKPAPLDLEHPLDPTAIDYIKKYAEEGLVTLDEESRKQLSLIVFEIPTTKKAKPNTAQAYLNETAEILKGILSESYC